MDSHDKIKFCEGSVNELPMTLKKIMLSLNVSDVFFISLLIQNQWHVFILHDGLWPSFTCLYDGHKSSFRCLYDDYITHLKGKDKSPEGVGQVHFPCVYIYVDY